MRSNFFCLVVGKLFPQITWHRLYVSWISEWIFFLGSPPQWSTLYYLTKKNLRNKVKIPFPWVFLGIKDVNGKATRRKREQKVWLDRSKQVYHLDDDQHQQNQSRIQALLLSISRALRLWGLWWWTINKTWHFSKTSTSSRMLTRTKKKTLNFFG